MSHRTRRNEGARSAQNAPAKLSFLQRVRRCLGFADVRSRFPAARSRHLRWGVIRRQSDEVQPHDASLSSPLVSPSHSEMDAHTATMWASLDALPEIAWTATPRGDLDFLNAQWYTYTGSSPAESTGQAWMQFIHPDDIQGARQVWADAVRDHMPARRTLRVRGANGGYRWFLVRSSPALDAAGNVIRWIGLSIDIHDRCTAEQQVVRERAVLHAVLEQIPAAVIVGEAPSGKVLVHNRRMAQVCRCANKTLSSYDSIAEYNSKPLKMYHSDGRPFLEEEWPLAQAIQHGRTIVDYVVGFERMDGTRGMLSINAAPVTDAHGVIIAGVVIAEDMQDRMAAENERVRLHADEAAARKTAELKQLLMANVSHEMRTPLNAIIGMGSILLSDAAAKRSLLTAEQIQCITDMRDSGQLLLTLVEDILTFSHLEAGKLVLRPGPFRLRELLDRAVSMMSTQARPKGLALNTRIDPELPEVVVGDEIRLRQVLVNLMSNAVKFTPKGGQISMHIASSAPRTVASSAQQLAAPREPGSLTQLQMSACGEQQPAAPTTCRPCAEASAPSGETLEGTHVGQPPEITIQFNVEDSGIGVAKEALPRLFKPFSQADATTTRKYGGTGLGLSICKRLVEAMGGDIGVAERSVSGAHFWFEVPVRLLSPSEAGGLGAADATDLLLQHAGAHAGICSLSREHAEHARTLEYSAEAAAAPLGVVLPVHAAGCSPRDVPPDAPPLHRVHLLVAEDNVVNQRVVQRILTRLGADVTIVGNGDAAVQRVIDAQPIFHAVLMDCAMPVCDGYEATKRIRELPDPRRRHVPIIALTAGALPEDVQRSLDAGMDAHVAKPLDPASLVATVRRFADASHARRAR